MQLRQSEEIIDFITDQLGGDWLLAGGAIIERFEQKRNTLGL